MSFEIWQQRNNQTASRLTDEARAPSDAIKCNSTNSFQPTEENEGNFLNSRQHGTSRREIDTNAIRAPCTPKSMNPPKPNRPSTPYVTIKRKRRSFSSSTVTNQISFDLEAIPRQKSGVMTWNLKQKCTIKLEIYRVPPDSSVGRILVFCSLLLAWLVLRCKIGPAMRDARLKNCHQTVCTPCAITTHDSRQQ